MMIHLSRSRLPRKTEPLQIKEYQSFILDSSGIAALDKRKYKADIGCWMIYLPKLQAKIFHAKHGMIDCTQDPKVQNLEDPNQPVGRYRVADWQNALQTPIYRRMGELWITSARLWRAGLGPQPLGLCFVNSFIRDGIELGPTCGFLSQNVRSLPRKMNCKLEQIVDAGVIPDYILSCVRQQLRGYVIDLCSVKGCQPLNASDQVEILAKLFEQRPDPSELILKLEEALAW